MCLIEYADELNNQLRNKREHWGIDDPYENKQYNAAYLKAIDVMKAFVTFKIQDLKRHPKQQYIRGAVNYFLNSVSNVENRLGSSEFASEFCGILPGYSEEKLKVLKALL